MNPYKAYQAQRQAGVPRVEVLLQIYDRLLELIGQARQALGRGDELAVRVPLAKAQLGVTAMAAGVDVSYGEVPQNMVRLYEYVGRRLQEGTAVALADAAKILTTLREGIEGIRDEALALERSGQIPSLDRESTFQATG